MGWDVFLTEGRDCHRGSGRFYAEVCIRKVLGMQMSA